MRRAKILNCAKNLAGDKMQDFIYEREVKMNQVFPLAKFYTFECARECPLRRGRMRTIEEMVKQNSFESALTIARFHPEQQQYLKGQIDELKKKAIEGDCVFDEKKRKALESLIQLISRDC